MEHEFIYNEETMSARREARTLLATVKSLNVKLA